MTTPRSRSSFVEAFWSSTDLAKLVDSARSDHARDPFAAVFVAAYGELVKLAGPRGPRPGGGTRPGASGCLARAVDRAIREQLAPAREWVLAVAAGAAIAVLSSLLAGILVGATHPIAWALVIALPAIAAATMAQARMLRRRDALRSFGDDVLSVLERTFL